MLFISWLTGGGPPYSFTSSIVRLNSNGTLDTSFDFSPKISASDPASVPNIRAIIAQPDGSVVFGGARNSVSGSALLSVTRLGSTGLLDGSFNATNVGGNGMFQTGHSPTASITCNSPVAIPSATTAISQTLATSITSTSATSISSTPTTGRVASTSTTSPAAASFILHRALASRISMTSV